MIIKTRYKDIPYSEVNAVHHMMLHDPYFAWEELRGKEIEIQTPPDSRTDGCGGPWYRVLTPVVDSPVCVVCPHLAEIGD